MIPPPPTRKPIAFYDTECYRNFWLLKFRPQDGPVYTFALYPCQVLSDVDVQRIRYLFQIFTVVSFNGNHYDVAMICAALYGFNCEQLKWLSDEIIINNVKPWELNLPEWKPADHIDIIEVLPGTGSQKQYAGRIHYKTMRDLPYDPSVTLTFEETGIVADYCENDLGQIEAEFMSLGPQIEMRESLTARYGIDLRSKSDAQCAEAIIKHRCEQALGYRIYKPEIDWNLKFRYEPPAFLSFATPQLQAAFRAVTESIFAIGANGAVEMPQQLDGLEIGLGTSVYRMGIGGLHSSEKCRYYRSSETHVLRDNDVRGYYPRLILNSGRYPKALGPQFLIEFGGIVDERDSNKAIQQKFEKAGVNPKLRENIEAYKAYSTNEGFKILSNGTFGKTGSVWSILNAPEMLIQTTLTGQLSLLMLIEWHEYYGIPVISANTDGFVTHCPRALIPTSEALIKEWEHRTGLEMEMSEYAALYSRDVNNYFAVKTSGEVKRKGEYSKAGLVEKKNPDVEICSDAAAEYLSKGTPVLYTIAACRDIRKFVTVRKVSGGAVKMWGEGPRKGMLVRDMGAVLEANGWIKVGRKWRHFQDPNDTDYNPQQAYESCFQPQRPEYIGKVVRWYYSTQAPGPIVYAGNGNTVSLSYGAKPTMILPETFPDDIDYDWYLQTAQGMLKEVGIAI